MPNKKPPPPKTLDEMDKMNLEELEAELAAAEIRHAELERRQAVQIKRLVQSFEEKPPTALQKFKKLFK